MEPSASSPQPLRDIAKAFKQLNESILSQESSGSAFRMDLKLLVAACETINVLFGLLGVAFAFAGKDYVDKVGEHDKLSPAQMFSLNHIHVSVSAQTGSPSLNRPLPLKLL